MSKSYDIGSRSYAPEMDEAEATRLAGTAGRIFSVFEYVGEAETENAKRHCISSSLAKNGGVRLFPKWRHSA